MHEQLILFGAPGTGKSYQIKEKLDSVSDSKIFRVTIYPEFQYSDFIGQILPITRGNATSFEFVPGPFTDALVEAYSDFSQNVYLVLEEISRGNIAAIFGDIFQLLDRDNHFESKYSIRNKNIASLIPALTCDAIKLPSNLNILCTVNVNDQNVFPMDTAFKRRFEWQYISTRPACDKQGNTDNHLNNPLISIPTNSKRSNDINISWLAFYTALNKFITDKQNGLGKNEDKQVGQFFIDFGDKLVVDSNSNKSNIARKAKIDVNNKIKNKLLLYLWQDVEETSLYGNTIKLFDKSINNYDELYMKFGKDKVFSDKFIKEFLNPGAKKYPY